MSFNTLDKRVLLPLMAFLVLPCAAMLVLDGAFFWWVLLFFALAVTIGVSWVRITFTFDSVSFYGYGLYFREYKYNRIDRIEPQYNDLKNPDIPECLLLSSCFKLRLKAFSPAARQAIFNTLEQKLADNTRSSGTDFLPWLKKQKKSKARQLLIIGIITLLVGAGYSASLLRWVWIVENWQEQELLIQERGTRQVRRRRRTKTIDTVRYTYLHQGKTYQGSTIVFDDDFLPSAIKPGRKWQGLIDPSDPAESCLLTNQRVRKYHWRFITPGIISIFGLIVIGFALRSMQKRPPAIPPELSEYIKTFPPAELRELSTTLTVAKSSASVNICTPLKIVEDRYGYFPQKRFGGLQILLLLLTLQFICGAFFTPFLLLGALYPFIFFLLTFLRQDAVLDLQKRKYFSCLFFRPGKSKIKNAVSFDTLHYVALMPHPKTSDIMLCLVCKNGDCHHWGTAKVKNPEHLLREVPKIAEMLGHLPVVINE